MKKIGSFHSAFAVYITQITALCNLYLFFVATQNENTIVIPIVPWLILGICNYMIVYLFLRKERAVAHLIYLGIFCYVLLAVAMSVFCIRDTSILSWITIWGFLAVPAAFACTFNLSGVKPQSVLLCCECPTMGIALLLFMDTGVTFTFPTENVVCALLALLCAFISLTMSKLESRNDNIVLERKNRAIGTILSCFIGMGLLAMAFVRFAMESTQAAVSKTTTAIGQLVDWIWTTISKVIAWFFSLFPTPEAEPMDFLLPENNAIEATEEVLVEADYSVVGLILLIGLCLGIVCLIVWLLRCFGKQKITKNVQTKRYHRPKIKQKKDPFWKKIKAFFKNKYQKLLFEIRLLYMHNTPKGATLILVKIGKTKGYPMQAGESYQSYLLRLYHHCMKVDTSVANSILHLADILNETLYAPCAPTTTLTKKDYQKMRMVVGRLKIEKHEKTEDTI